MHSTPADRKLTLENCEAVYVKLGTLRAVVVWRDGPKYLRPAEHGKRIRDLQLGDAVFYHDKPETIHSIEP